MINRFSKNHRSSINVILGFLLSHWSFTLTVSLCRLILGCVFLFSSIEKFQQPYNFLFAVYDYEIVGPSFGLVVAFIVPWVELILGLCLLFGIFRYGAFLLSITLLSIFLFVISWALLHDLKIQCGCLGRAGSLINRWDLVRVIFLLAVAIIGFAFSSARSIFLNERTINEWGVEFVSE